MLPVVPLQLLVIWNYLFCFQHPLLKLVQNHIVFTIIHSYLQSLTSMSTATAAKGGRMEKEEPTLAETMPLSRRRRKWVSRDVSHFQQVEQVGEGTYG